MMNTIQVLKNEQALTGVHLLDDGMTDAEIICVAYCNNLCVGNMQDLLDGLTYPQIISADVSTTYNYTARTPQELISALQVIDAEMFDEALADEPSAKVQVNSVDLIYNAIAGIIDEADLSSDDLTELKAMLKTLI